MDAPQPSPEPRRRHSGSFRAACNSARPYLIHLLWLSAGWLGAQTVLPGPRISKVEAQQVAQQLAFETHVKWSETKNELLEGLARLKCYELQETPAGREKLTLSKIPCNELLGNQVPAQ